MNRPLSEYVDRIFVISSKHRKARLERLLGSLTENMLARREEVEVRNAILGSCVPHLEGWTTSEGAWGCYLSHLRLLEDMLQERDDFGALTWKTYVAFEDDAVFRPGARQELADFFNIIPADFGQVYLGGQHTIPPVEVSKGLVKGRSVNRTHSYMVHARYAGDIYKYLLGLPHTGPGCVKHIDHWLEKAHRGNLWPTYCPTKWFFGQGEGESDIQAGRHFRNRFWD